MQRLRDDSGVALVTALFSTIVMLALGLALLSIVDTQTSESASERTRDRGFNLSESVLNSQAFVLGRNWPDAVPGRQPGMLGRGIRLRRHARHDRAHRSGCLSATANAQPTAAAGSPLAATTRIRPNLNASYTDGAYANATWQVNVCDDVDPDGAGPTGRHHLGPLHAALQGRTGTPTEQPRLGPRAVDGRHEDPRPRRPRAGHERRRGRTRSTASSPATSATISDRPRPRSRTWR